MVFHKNTKLGHSKYNSGATATRNYRTRPASAEFLIQGGSKTDIRVPAYPLFFENASTAKVLRWMQKDLL
jgi:hypothetical protein